MTWKPIPGFSSQLVSDTGLVRSLPNSQHNGIVRKTQINQFGYWTVSGMRRDSGKPITLSVHRAVALAFIPNPDNKPEVSHKDGVRAHNWASNLEWCTSSESRKHAVERGTSYRGELNSQAKLNRTNVREIRQLYAQGLRPLRAIGDRYGVQSSAIRQVVTGRTWGYV